MGQQLAQFGTVVDLVLQLTTEVKLLKEQVGSSGNSKELVNSTQGGSQPLAPVMVQVQTPEKMELPPAIKKLLKRMH